MNNSQSSPFSQFNSLNKQQMTQFSAQPNNQNQQSILIRNLNSQQQQQSFQNDGQFTSQNQQQQISSNINILGSQNQQQINQNSRQLSGQKNPTIQSLFINRSNVQNQQVNNQVQQFEMSEHDYQLGTRNNQDHYQIDEEQYDDTNNDNKVPKNSKFEFQNLPYTSRVQIMYEHIKQKKETSNDQYKKSLNNKRQNYQMFALDDEESKKIIENVMFYNPNSRYFYYENSLVGDMVLIKDEQKEQSAYVCQIYKKLGLLFPLIYGILMTLILLLIIYVQYMKSKKQYMNSFEAIKDMKRMININPIEDVKIKKYSEKCDSGYSEQMLTSFEGLIDGCVCFKMQKDTSNKLYYTAQHRVSESKCEYQSTCYDLPTQIYGKKTKNLKVQLINYNKGKSIKMNIWNGFKFCAKTIPKTDWKYQHQVSSVLCPTGYNTCDFNICVKSNYKCPYISIKLKKSNVGGKQLLQNSLEFQRTLDKTNKELLDKHSKGQKLTDAEKKKLEVSKYYGSMIFFDAVDSSTKANCILDAKYSPLTDIGEKKKKLNLRIPNPKLSDIGTKYHFSFYPGFKTSNRGCDKILGYKKMVQKVDQMNSALFYDENGVKSIYDQLFYYNDIINQDINMMTLYTVHKPNIKQIHNCKFIFDDNFDKYINQMQIIVNQQGQFSKISIILSITSFLLSMLGLWVYQYKLLNTSLFSNISKICCISLAILMIYQQSYFFYVHNQYQLSKHSVMYQKTIKENCIDNEYTRSAQNINEFQEKFSQIIINVNFACFVFSVSYIILQAYVLFKQNEAAIWDFIQCKK